MLPFVFFLYDNYLMINIKHVTYFYNSFVTTTYSLKLGVEFYGFFVQVYRTYYLFNDQYQTYNLIINTTVESVYNDIEGK